MLLEEVAVMLREQINELSKRVSKLEAHSHQPVNWKELIDIMEERLIRLESEVNSIKKT
tara:strand:- start:346 stop:522 length:177 start_codon:yes stop_codon:yes gene_type:complete